MVEERVGALRIEFDAARAAFYDDEVSEYEIYDDTALLPYLDKFAGRELQLSALDLGCGTGAVTAHLARRGFTVQAVDVSPGMIAVAKSKLKRAGIDNRVTFHESEGANLPFADGEFDLVTCQRVLHHIPNIAPVFAEVQRVLRPGGSFYLSDVVSDATPAGRALRSAWGALLRLRKGNGSSGLPPGLHADGDGRELHRPASEFTQLLASRGFSYQLRFFTHVGLQRHLSTKERSIAIRVLSAPWRTRGDVLFVYATRVG